MEKQVKNESNIQELKMPKMGESITEGTIINWLLEEGESFNEGDILLEVATDKVDNEVPAPFSGKILEIKAGAQEVIPVGEILALLEKDESGGKTSSDNEVPIQKSVSNQNNSPKSQKRESTSTEKPLRVTNSNRFYSPLVIEIAKEHHISFEELARIPSSGDNGRLRKSDVYRYIQDGRPYKFAQPVEDSGFKLPDLKFDKGKGRIIEMDRMRKMISDHMVYSKHVAPHVTSYVEADLTDLVAWRKNHKEDFQEKYGEKLTFTPLFIEAVAKAIGEFPDINASVDGNKIIVKEEINIGMATALPNGNLIVPVVRDADKKDLVSLAKNVNQLVEKARNNELGGDDVKGSTFTISNVGTFGSLMGTPIINQPEVAILALGIIKKRPEVIQEDGEDKIAIRQMMFLSLSFDHRVVDGYLGGSFLRKVADNLENFDVNRNI